MKLYFMLAVLTALPASAQFYQRPPSVDQLLASTKAKPPEHHHALRPKLKLPANEKGDVDTSPFLGVDQTEKKPPKKDEKK